MLLPASPPPRAWAPLSVPCYAVVRAVRACCRPSPLHPPAGSHQVHVAATHRMLCACYAKPGTDASVLRERV
eukprot:540800-Rhodomonas_salina.1